ncbi:hypothetical protein [Actinoplanes xinjiangensis]|uniref:hypothetical protein n=1 Tax=Actinoplanes xinjiangensis TaxID=512350 RepID=UPI0011B6BA9A|nr:hypothetical protein [Actinoplanes xinjiangensis]
MTTIVAIPPSYSPSCGSARGDGTLGHGRVPVGAHPEEREPGGGRGAAWTVCLAVLVALTAAVLQSAWLLRRRAGRSVSAGKERFPSR